MSASFGEMLLLVAMYFHSNQLSAIIDLVCSTLGMKVNPKLFLAHTFLLKLIFLLCIYTLVFTLVLIERTLVLLIYLKQM